MRIAFLILLVFIASKSVGQNVDTLNFYPLELGNTWTYFQVLEPPFMPPDTIWGGTYTIESQTSINDTLYTQAPHPFALATMLRYDDEGRIWARVNEQDVLYWDFTLEEEQTYPFIEKDGTEYEVELEHIGSIDIGGGHFDSVIMLHFKWLPGVDNDRYYAFARGSGIVMAYGGLGAYQELYSATIGGKIITSTEKPDKVEHLTVSVYPNPAYSRSQIEIKGITSSLKVHLVDVLGRQLRVYRTEDCREACHIEVIRGDLATGLYFIMLETSTGSRFLTKLIFKG